MFNAAVFDLAPEPVSARPGLAKVLATQGQKDIRQIQGNRGGSAKSE